MAAQYSSLSVTILLILWAAGAPTRLAAAESPGATLAEVLGPNAAQWKITPAQFVLAGEPGHATLAAPAGQVLALESNTVAAVPFECQIACRLQPAKGAVSYIGLQLGAPQQALSF